MTTTSTSLSRPRAAVEYARTVASRQTPKTYGARNQSELAMIRADLAAAVETLRAMEQREADAIAFAKEVVK